jgi:hypothetical protein
VKNDPDVAQGHVMYNLLMRALPFYYRGNSVYAMFPLVVPEENRKILKKLKKDQDYNFDRPSFIGLPTTVKTWQGVTSVLSNQAAFKVPCTSDIMLNMIAAFTDLRRGPSYLLPYSSRLHAKRRWTARSSSEVRDIERDILSGPLGRGSQEVL